MTVDVPCEVRLVPPDALEAWRRGTDDLTTELDAIPKSELDCREVLVQAAPGGRAFVTVTTRDGRRASRPVSSPAELLPIVTALGIGGSGVEVAADSPPRPPPPEPARAPDASGRVLVGLSAGAHLGMPGGFVFPAAQASAAIGAAHWDVGVFAIWDIACIASSQPRPPRFEMWSVGVGLSLGRREMVGPTSVFFGVRGGGAIVSQEIVNPDDTPEGTRAEPRLGAFVGARTPSVGKVRLVPEIDVDMVPTGLFRTVSIDPRFPALPSWNVGAMVGVEGEVL